MAASKNMTDLIVGVVFLIGITLIGVFTIIVSDYNPFHSYNYWYVDFPNVAGLTNGEEVRVSGVVVGRVKNIELLDAGAHVVLQLDKQIPFYENGRIMIENVSALGGKFVSISTGGPPAKKLDTSKTLQGEPPPEDITNALNKFMTELREGEGTLPRLIREPDIYNDIKNVTGSLSTVADNLKDGKGLIGRLTSAKSEKLYDDVEQIVVSVRSAADQIKDKKGTIGKLVYDDALYDQLNSATDSISEIASNLKNGKGTVGKLLNDDEIYNNIRDISQTIKNGDGVIGKLMKDKKMGEDFRNLVANLDNIAASIENGEGTLGLLVKEDKIYRDLEATTASIRTAAANIANSKGTIGKLINESEIYNKIDRLVTELTEATGDAREAAPVTAFGTVLLAGFR